MIPASGLGAAFFLAWVYSSLPVFHRPIPAMLGGERDQDRVGQRVATHDFDHSFRALRQIC